MREVDHFIDGGYCAAASGARIAREDPATGAPLRAIARAALAQKSGARGLRAVMERVMLDFMYELPSDEETTTLSIAREHVIAHFPEGAKASSNTSPSAA